MNKTVADVNAERRAKYDTLKNTYKQFPVGTRVQVICVAQDFSFFAGTEEGVVIKNKGDYLGIIVKFDARHQRPEFNFEPKDLIVLQPETPSLVARFQKAYANVPLGLRSEIVAVLDKEPMAWHVVKLEVDVGTPMAARLLEYLDKLELI